MVQAAHAADQPQQVRERFALVSGAVAVAAAVPNIAAATTAAALSEHTFAHDCRQTEHVTC